MRKRLISVFIAILFVGMFGTISANAITQQEAVNWVKTQADNSVGFDVDNLYSRQCSDFASAYINYLIYGDPYYWLNTGGSGFTTYMGYNYFYQTYPSGWQKIENTSDFVPQAGDILCFGPGIYNDAGHVAVAIDGCTVSYMKAVDQDGLTNSTTRYSTLNYFTNYYNFQGVIRPKFDNAPTPVNLGDSFYAYIINKPCWKMVAHDSSKNVVLQTETGKANQLWKFTRLSNGAYHINSLTDGAYLDVDGAASAAGTNVKVCGYSGSNAQEWTIYGTSDNYRLTAGCTDCVLDLQEGSTADGTNVQMYTSNDTNAQIFQIYTIEKRTPTLSVAVGTAATDTTFSWNNVYGALYHDLYIYNSSGSEYKKVSAISGNSTKLNLPGGTYTAKIRMYNYYYESYSSTISFTVTNPTYTVSYNANGGSGAPGNQTKTYGTNLTLSSTKPTRAGYTFKNWNTAANGSGTAYNAGATYTANAGVTLYAQWTLNKPTNLTISANKKELYLGDNITFTFAHSGATAASLDIYLNGDVEYVNAMGKTSYVYTPKSTGTYTVYLSATNSAGNVVSSAVTFTVTNPEHLLKIRTNGGTWQDGAWQGLNEVTEKIKKGETLEIKNPKKAEHDFLGWALDYSGSGQVITPWGRPLHVDPVFANSMGGVNVYNYKEGNAVSINKVAHDNSAPTQSSQYMLEITNTGEAWPEHGGFYQFTQSKAGGVFYHVIVAKIPKECCIAFSFNNCGDGFYLEWLTSTQGTGEWQTYIYKVTCGTSGTFQDFGYAYISGGEIPTPEKPLKWYVCYAEMFDATGLEDISVSKQGTTNITQGSGVSYLYALWAKYKCIDCFKNTVVQKDGNINITLDRKHDTPYPMKVIVVQYDSYKKAIDIFTDSRENGNDDEQYTYSLPIVDGASKVSVFVWNESTLEPLAYSQTITIE